LRLCIADARRGNFLAFAGTAKRGVCLVWLAIYTIFTGLYNEIHVFFIRVPGSRISAATAAAISGWQYAFFTHISGGWHTPTAAIIIFTVLSGEWSAIFSGGTSKN
jgi:hypothetical protein